MEKVNKMSKLKRTAVKSAAKPRLPAKKPKLWNEVCQNKLEELFNQGDVLVSDKSPDVLESYSEFKGLSPQAFAYHFRKAKTAFGDSCK